MLSIIYSFFVFPAPLQLGLPTTFRELVGRALALPSPSGISIWSNINIPAPLFEESNEDLEANGHLGEVLEGQKQVFPSPAKMVSPS